MKKLIKVIPFRVFLFVALLFGSDISARARGQSPAVAPGMVSDIQHPNPTGSNPKPEDATMAILAAFEKYEVVGMSAAHGNKDLDDSFSLLSAILLFLARSMTSPWNAAIPYTSPS
jgi:hypothetical protein